MRKRNSNPEMARSRALERSERIERANAEPKNKAQRALLKAVEYFVQVAEARMAGGGGVCAVNPEKVAGHHDPAAPTLSDYYVDFCLAVRAALHDKVREAEFYRWCTKTVEGDDGKSYRDARRWTAVGVEIVRRGLDQSTYFKPTRAHGPAKLRGQSTLAIQKKYERLRGENFTARVR